MKKTGSSAFSPPVSPRTEQESTSYYFPFLSIILQNITATPVLTAVAAIAGPTMAVGFTLPYWLR